MMIDKKEARQRRAARSRKHIAELRAVSICVHRTPRHIYAYLISGDRSKTLAAASTLDAGIRKAVKATGNIEAAKLVGKLIAERAQKLGVKEVAFDRSGFKYHGRVKALADSAREAGLVF